MKTVLHSVCISDSVPSSCCHPPALTYIRLFFVQKLFKDVVIPPPEEE